jgi:hypothetical protein
MLFFVLESVVRLSAPQEWLRSLSRTLCIECWAGLVLQTHLGYDKYRHVLPPQTENDFCKNALSSTVLFVSLGAEASAFASLLCSKIECFLGLRTLTTIVLQET